MPTITDPPMERPFDRASSSDQDLKSDVRLVKYQVEQLDKKFDTLTTELKNSYATKTELSVIRDDVTSLKNNVSWIVKLILGAVIMAVLGVVLVKGGVTH
ncbi:MAG: hypothetical protein K2Y56_24180 [Methylobacterium sp.]|uniref:hypothetical protein n=1 Tax=Methylobacterium sp. TaxID=409 RepID=UPI0025E39390|nr:hypothetical protein [Methylobacterium sp.]MBX9934577.1 hypothetical protein [Methylobacterium sp.]